MRYEEKFRHILKCSSKIFSEKGFHKASMRDISKVTKISLSGLYHYFKSKEEILFMIQNFAFSSIIETLERGIENLETPDPEDKLHFLVHNHLNYFLNNIDDQKVCTREGESLKGDYNERLNSVRRKYFYMARSIVEDVKMANDVSTSDTGTETLCLFGTMNWTHTWYDPLRNGDERYLTDLITDMFLNGLLGKKSKRMDKVFLKSNN